MGYRDASADAGGAEKLALEDRLDDIFRLGCLEIADAAQALDHFPDDALLGGGRQIRNDGLADDKIRHTHVLPPSHAPGESRGLHSSVGSSRALPATSPADGVRRWSWIF